MSGQLTTNQFRLLSDIISRAALANRLGQQYNGDRDMYEVLGYKKSLSYADYWQKYDRQDIAGRIVDAPARTTWRNTPDILDGESEDGTAFLESFDALIKQTRLYHYCERVDRLAGIGRYGVMVVGVAGETILSEPVEDDSLSGIDDIIYLSTFSEGSCEIEEWDTDPKSPRFGKPLVYSIDFNGDLSESGDDVDWDDVHWSRVIHVAEDLLEDEVYGRPRLRRVMNRLDDMEKVIGGSSEMFWRGADRGIHADVRDDHELSEEEEEAFDDEIQAYIHNLQRVVRTKGVDLKAIEGMAADQLNPRNAFEVLTSIVSAVTNIPKRILIGSERGDLASSQDEANWFGYIAERQRHFAEPQVLRPFIDWCIDKGTLPEPSKEYIIEWPNLFELNKVEESEVSHRKSQAAKNIAPAGSPELIMTREEMREMLGLPAEMPDDLQEEPLPEDDEEVSEQFEREMGDA